MSWTSSMSRQSTRTPTTQRSQNPADVIEDCMRHDNEDKWGFVIYRCTYSSSADWDTFLTSFREHARKVFEFWNGLDIFERLEMTVIDDPTTLDGASTQVVRAHFREWSRDKDVDEWVKCQRPRFCIQVDEASLHSIVQAAAEGIRTPGEPVGGFMNIVWKRWDPDEADDGWIYEPVEGLTLKDVGWMRTALSMMVFVYRMFRDEDMWDSQYVRPPAVLIQ